MYPESPPRFEPGDLEKTLYTDYGEALSEDIISDYKYDRKGNWEKKTVYSHRIGYKPVKTYETTRKISYR